MCSFDLIALTVKNQFQYSYKSLTEKERNKIIYVNVLDESGKDLAKAMGVEKAATAVIYHKDKNFWWMVQTN